MKRLLWIPLLFLCSTLWAAEPVQLARMNPYIAGVGVATACTVETLTCTAGSGDSAIINFDTSDATSNFGSTTQQAGTFVLAKDTRITKYTVYLRDNNPTYDAANVTASIRADSSGKPTGSDIAGSAVVVAESSIANGSLGDVTFTLSTPTNFTAATYHLVTVGDTAEVADTAVARQTGASGYTANVSTDGGSTWTTGANTRRRMAIYGCQCP